MSGLLAVALLAAGCSGGKHAAAAAGGSDQDVTVNIALTPQGCKPQPASVTAGHVQFNVDNKNASAVSEAELRSGDRSHILGEQENLTPGLSGGFALDVQPGSYEINCPGASQQHWTFTVTGKASGPSWQSDPQLKTAVAAYSAYIDQNVDELVTSSQAFCTAIGTGDLTTAELAYPRARIHYERIEPVAEVWGDLDTDIDGRWENPVTVASRFMGFHKLEQLMWEDDTLKGAPAVCSGLVAHEQQLRTLVHAAQYSPLEMAAGATDLINEASTAKITGEEERYSNTDFVVFQANVDGAKEVLDLLTPYLDKADPGLVTTIGKRQATVYKLLVGYAAKPGYDSTGYVEYSTVLDTGRKSLSGAVNAYAEALSQMSEHVSVG